MTGRPAHCPTRWPVAYNLGRRIDTAAELAAYVGWSAFMVAAVTGERVADAIVVWREERSARWQARILRHLDAMHYGEDGWDE